MSGTILSALHKSRLTPDSCDFTVLKISLKAPLQARHYTLIIPNNPVRCAIIRPILWLRTLGSESKLAIILFHLTGGKI